MASDANLTYWMEDDAEFHVDYNALITRDGAFYVDPEGRLVICFDEYDVAPGFHGSPELYREPRGNSGAAQVISADRSFQP